MDTLSGGAAVVIFALCALLYALIYTSSIAVSGFLSLTYILVVMRRNQKNAACRVRWTYQLGLA